MGRVAGNGIRVIQVVDGSGSDPWRTDAGGNWWRGMVCIG